MKLPGKQFSCHVFQGFSWRKQLRFWKWLNAVSKIRGLVLKIAFVDNSAHSFLAKQIVCKYNMCMKQTYTVPTYDIHVAPNVLHGLTDTARTVQEEEDEFSQDITETGCLVTLCRLHCLCLFSAQMVKSCEDDICPCSSTLEDDMYVRADELYCLLKLMWKYC